MKSENKKTRPKNLGRNLKRLMVYFKNSKLLIFMIIVCTIITAAASVVSVSLIKPLIDDKIMPLVGVENPDMTEFLRFIIIIGIIYIVSIISSFVSARLLINLSTEIMKNIRMEMFSKMQKLPLNYFDTHIHGDIMSKYTVDVDALRQMISQSLPQAISSLLSIIMALVFMFILSPILALLSIFSFVGVVYIVSRIAKKSAKYFMLQHKNIGAMNGYVEEMIEGQKVVKVFNHEEESKSNFDKHNQNLFEVTSKANTYAFILFPLMRNIGYMQYAIIAVAGGVLAINGYFMLGTVASFMLLVNQLLHPIIRISQEINSVLSAIAGAERIFELIDQTEEVNAGKVRRVYAVFNEHGELEESETPTNISAWKWPIESGNKLTEVKGHVIFNRVSFGYKEDRLILKDISLYAKPSHKIAFVGSTGAGKTTVTNLVNRFYDIQSGEITFDGINIKDIDKSDLRKSISMVLQDTHLFNGTIRDNIKYSKIDATDEEVIASAIAANAHPFIMSMPDGYDTKLTGDGSNLSQGQRQLISIARAMIANAPVLILDEATSSIDTRTEKLIEKGIEKLMEGKTVFVIAHRLSTVRHSNAIMLLENGEIIERGTHEELIIAKGRYYNLNIGLAELV